MRKTKIVCTLGPSTDDEKVLRELVLNGMNVARVNMSHGQHDEQRKRINTLKAIRTELNKPIALLLDTKGPEVRVKSFKEGKVELVPGQEFTLTTREVEGDNTICSVTFANLPNDVSEKTRILIDDGLIELVVKEIDKTDIICKVINGGKVSNNKGINVPGHNLSMPFLSEKDKNDIKFAVEEDFDFIAASFVTEMEDIMQIRRELLKHDCDDIKIIAKIENAQGVDNIDGIIKASDGIMVARGDMGVEIPFAELPSIQKMIIQKVYKAGKQVITATQMLESMVNNPRPTRAEVSDVANAVYDGTSAVMLSGETAAGKYPVEALKTMSTVARKTEDDINYMARFDKWDNNEVADVTNAISHATCTTAHDLGARAILNVTRSGMSARMISKYRPFTPIITGSSSEKVLRQMNMSWGVTPVKVEEVSSSDALFDQIVDVAVKENLISSGDLVVITAGVPLGVSGTTNMLKVQLVGNILVSGTAVNDGVVEGRLCVCQDEKELFAKFEKGDIVVVPSTSNAVMSILRNAKAIVTEESGINSHAAVTALALDKPAIIGATNATKILSHGAVACVDTKKSSVINTKK